MINKLESIIRQNNQKIKLNFSVDNIKLNGDTYIINNKYKSKNIIFAITINNLQTILNKTNIIDINYKKYIGTVPFLRIYTYHKNGHKLNIPRYSITDNQIEKIIVISDEILMISYSDYKYADYWYNLYNTDKEKLLDKLKQLFIKSTGQNIDIDDIEFAYWDEGIHYYYPQKDIKLNKIISNLSNPCDNIYVIGEMLSYKQGWVEGAIESANRIYKLIK